MKEAPTQKMFYSMLTAIMWSETNQGGHKLSLMTW